VGITRFLQSTPFALHQIMTLSNLPSHGVGAWNALLTFPTKLDA
jgi:hypothetical protein